MFTFFGAKQAFCDRVTRRNFLQIGAFGAGLTLADLLRARALGSDSAVSTPPPRAKSAIMIYLPGGPSHMDMFDLKPDAPAEFRGEFNPIATNVPGVRICEHMPRLAAMWDKCAVVRSVISADEHSDSYVMTGKTQRENMTANHPSFGAVMSRVRGGSGNAPTFVSLRGMSRGTEPGFLGTNHRPFSPSGAGVQDLAPLPGMNEQRVSDRRSMLEAFDSARADLEISTGASDQFTARAFDMIASNTVRNALNNSLEPSASRARYQGVEQFLTARRLIEAGVGCVTLSIGSWDTHGNNFSALRRQLPQVDLGLSSLIGDLVERGLHDDVAVIMWGEFGRTPRINRGGGRDHWSPVMSAFVSGGGLRMGQAVGASTPRGERPQDRPYRVPQVLSTIYRAMGIDPARTFTNGFGRPIHIVEDREPVRELI